MLVLTRKCGEHIVIGDDILVTVVACNGRQVRIGISAPPDVSVDRLEVADRKRAENSGRFITSHEAFSKD